MNNDKDITDQEIEQYLEGQSELSDIYAEGSKLKAPEHLEFAVKRMAREAEATGTHSSISKKTKLIPLSIAASIMIAIGLSVFISLQQTNEQLQIVEQQIPAETQPKTATHETPAPANETELTQTQPATIQQTPQRSETTLAETRPLQPATQEKTQTTQDQVATNRSEDDSDFELPPHLREMVQSTSTGGSNELLPPEVLKNWTREQWHQQVNKLKEVGNETLAQRYIDEYPRYFSGEKFKAQ